MLPDRHTQLLTAYVDGELSQRQRKAVLRLLRHSPDARALLRQLQADAAAVRGLPRFQLGDDFTARVVHAAAERRVPLRRLARVPPQPLPPWLGVALAASVLLVVGLGSYLYFAQTLPERHRGEPIVQRTPNATTPEEPRPSPQPPEVQPGPATNKETSQEPKPRETSKEEPVQVVRGSTEKHEPPKATTPEAPNESALTLPVPGMEMFQPHDVQVALPLILKFRELDMGKLRAELQKDSGYRLEVPCRESAHAFERLQGVLKGHGIGLVIDQVAQARLKQPKMKTNFVLYAEDLTPEQLAQILEQVGAEDRKAESKHRGDGQFDGLVVARMNKDDGVELSKLLGVDPRQVQEHKPAEAGTNAAPKKPAAEGSTARSESRKPPAKAPEHLALVLAYNPVRPRPGSAEVKRFLDSRKPSRPGTLQVLLVLRETNG